MILEIYTWDHLNDLLRSVTEKMFISYERFKVFIGILIISINWNTLKNNRRLSVLNRYFFFLVFDDLTVR